MSFDDVIAWDRDGDGWTGTVDATWMQGRAAFGGLVAGVAARALGSLVDRPLRSIDATLIGPLTDDVPARCTASVVRAGRSVTFAEARILQRDRPIARFTAVFGEGRPSGIAVPARRPADVPPRSAVVPFVRRAGVPRFIEHLDMAFAGGRFPFTGQTEPGVSGWCRFRGPATGVPGLLALTDAWPAPVLPMLRRPAPASTVRWTTHVVGPVTDANDGDWWFESRCVHAADGYAVIAARLYGPSGALVTWSEQLVAVFDGAPGG